MKDHISSLDRLGKQFRGRSEKHAGVGLISACVFTLLQFANALEKSPATTAPLEALSVKAYPVKSLAWLLKDQSLESSSSVMKTTTTTVDWSPSFKVTSVTRCRIKNRPIFAKNGPKVDQPLRKLD